MIDESTDFGQRVARHLTDDPVVWLTTVTPGGQPVPNPVWFWWDGEETIRIYTLPGQPPGAHHRGQPEGVAELPRDRDRRRHRRPQRPRDGARGGRAGVRARGLRREVPRPGWTGSSSTPEQFAQRYSDGGRRAPHQGPRVLVATIRTAGPEDLDTVTELLIGFRDWWELGLAVRRDVPHHSGEAARGPEHRVPARRNRRPRADPLPPVRLDRAPRTAGSKTSTSGTRRAGRAWARRSPRPPSTAPAPAGASASSSTSTSRTRTRSASTRASASRSSPSRPAARCSWARSSSSCPSCATTGTAVPAAVRLACPPTPPGARTA